MSYNEGFKKPVYNKVVFFILGGKAIFLPQNGGTIKKEIINLNLYIGINIIAFMSKFLFFGKRRSLP